jgi:hypothetical protein
VGIGDVGIGDGNASFLQRRHVAQRVAGEHTVEAWEARPKAGISDIGLPEHVLHRGLAAGHGGVDILGAKERVVLPVSAIMFGRASSGGLVRSSTRSVQYLNAVPTVTPLVACGLNQP